MSGKKGLLVSFVLIALVGMLAVVSFCDNSTDVNAAGSNQFNLASALGHASAGDTVTLTADTTLSANVTVSSGVTLDDGGFALRLLTNSTLSIEGTFISTGNLTADYGAVIDVTDGGVMSSDGNVTYILGSLNVYPNGTLNIGPSESSTFRCGGSSGNLSIEGKMTVGSNSTVELGNGTISGSTSGKDSEGSINLQISNGSTFNVYDTLIIGRAPILTTNLSNDTVISGKITIGNKACILAYGQSGFSSTANISNKTPVSTQFVIGGEIYATAYKDVKGDRTLIIPSTSSLRDYAVTWNDSSGNAITNDSDKQIGSTGYTTIYGVATKINYMIVLSEDNSIRWIVNGVNKGSSVEMQGAYGAPFTINISLAPGSTESLPDIFMNGGPFKAGASFTVTGDTTFTTSNNYPTHSSDKMPILLAILGIMIVILILALAALVIKNRNKAKTE